MRYKVYKIEPSPCYSGISLVAAENEEVANKEIEDFKNRDNDNNLNSWGYGKVSESDVIDNLYSDERGIMLYGIYYSW